MIRKIFVSKTRKGKYHACWKTVYTDIEGDYIKYKGEQIYLDDMKHDEYSYII